MSTVTKHLTLLFFFFAGLAAARESSLGKIEFPTSGGAQAQAHFIRGVLLLHSFEYRDARAAFQEAQQVEPNFAMAFWGEAMTHNHPIWNRQNREAGRAVLQRLGKTLTARLEKAPSHREKDYLRTLDVLFGEGDKLERDLAYSNAMRDLSERYPDDLEAASFYALSILGTAQGKRDFRIYMRAGATADAVFDKNPMHPGAAHYVIHSFDDPIHAPLGLRAADVYADIAPDAPHALHMPSHIFMALGMWDRSAASNEASYAAARKKDQSGHHATWWQHYSYLQQGRYEAAERVLTRIEQVMRNEPAAHTRNHVAYMRASYHSETRTWPEAVFKDFDLKEMRLSAQASVLLTRAQVALQTGRIAEAEATLAQIGQLPPETARYADKESTRLIELQLAGLIALAREQPEEAIAKLTEAIRVFESMSLEFGPPVPVKPVHEFLGEVFLALNRPHDAVRMFNDALSRDPRRALSLLGLARALEQTQRPEESVKAYRELRQVWHRADPGLPELQEIESKIQRLSVSNP